MPGRRIAPTLIALILPWLIAAPARSQVLAHPIEVEGTVVYRLKKAVLNNYKGTIQSLDVGLNQTVSKGQVLGSYRLDAFERNQLRGEISTSKINNISIRIGQMTAEINVKKRELNAELVLLDEGMTSQLSVDAKRDELVLLKDRLDYATEELRVEKRNLARTKALISENMGGVPIGNDVPTAARLVSPLDGKVLSIIEEPDWAIKRNTACFTVADTRDVLVLAKIFLEDYPKIAEGMKASITSRNHPGKTFQATITRIPLTPISKAYANLSYYNVELRIQGADDIFREGNSVTVTIPPQTADTAAKQ